MATKEEQDRYDNQTVAEFENESLLRFNKEMEEALDREAKMHRHHFWRGNKLPPFNIQHMPHERQRLDKEMTEEDRMLRKQWLDDQILAPNEPIYIPELYPRHPIRRFFGKPWDMTFDALKPILGPQKAFTGRFWTPKLAIALTVVYACYYHVKFNYSKWHSVAGWHVYGSKPVVHYKSQRIPDKQHDDFYDRDFKKRTCLREGKTSVPP